VAHFNLSYMWILESLYSVEGNLVIEYNASFLVLKDYSF
jgi:hypothetical protein